MTQELTESRRWTIAYLLFQHWTPSQIGTKLGIETGTVSKFKRLLESADNKYLPTAFNAAEAPWKEMELQLLPITAKHLSLQNLLADKELSKKLDKDSFADILKRQTKARNLTRVIVCGSTPGHQDWKKDEFDPDATKRSKNTAVRMRPVNPIDWDTDDPKTWELRFAVFGRAAAPHVCDLLQHSNVVGLAWGSTIRCVVDELHRQRIALPERHRSIETVATVGESIGDKTADDGISSSHLASRLCEAIGHKPNKDAAHQLRGVPAMLPFTFEDVPAAKKGLLGYPNYKQIFGKGGAISRLDTVLTSVGNVSQTNKLYRRELEAGGFDEAKLKHYVDIGGALVPLLQGEKRHQLATRDSETVFQQVTERWTGMKFDDYLRLAKKCGSEYAETLNTEQRPRGVVVLAMGRNKRDVVRQCLQHDIINVLIIDEDLAFALLDSAPQSLPARR